MNLSKLKIAAATAILFILATGVIFARTPPPPPPPPPGGPTPTSYVGSWSGSVVEAAVAPGSQSTINGTLKITISSTGSISGTGPIGGVVSGQIDLSSGNISYIVVTTINGQTTTGSISGTLSFVPGGLSGQLNGTFTNPNAPSASSTVSDYVKLTPA